MYFFRYFLAVLLIISGTAAFAEGGGTGENDENSPNAANVPAPPPSTPTAKRPRPDTTGWDTPTCQIQNGSDISTASKSVRGFTPLRQAFAEDSVTGENDENSPNAANVPAPPSSTSTAKLPRPDTTGWDTPTCRTRDGSDLSPVSKSARDLYPLRLRLLVLGYDTSGNRVPVLMRDLHQAIDEHLPDYSWVSIAGEKVYLVPGLFKPEQSFLTGDVWKTNQERMEMGMAPVCYRAFIPEAERGNYTFSEIRRLQKRWLVHLHHLDLTHGYALLMIVCPLHMGSDWGFYVDFSGDKLVVVASQISKEDAPKYKKTKTHKFIKNVLHPLIAEHQNSEDIKVLAHLHKKTSSPVYTRKKTSKISRRIFRPQRKIIWKTTASDDVSIPEVTIVSRVPAAPRINRSQRRRGNTSIKPRVIRSLDLILALASLEEDLSSESPSTASPVPMAPLTTRREPKQETPFTFWSDEDLFY